MRGRGKPWIPFLLPSLAGTAVLVVLPFADVIRRSFLTAVTGKFNGLANYREVFHNQAFLLALGNTAKFTAVCLPLLIGLSLLPAAALCGMKGSKPVRTMLLFPLAIPTAAMAVAWRLLFSRQGFLNLVLTRLSGFGGEGRMVMVDFLGTGAAFSVLVFTYLWKNLGYTVILWMAGIQGVSPDILEAARVDGAGRRQCFFQIVLPNLRGTLYTIVVLSFLNSFKVYREAYLVAGAYPDKSMYLLQHLFNNWFTNLDLDKMAAAAVCVGTFLFLVNLLLQRLWEKRE